MYINVSVNNQKWAPLIYLHVQKLFNANENTLQIIIIYINLGL